MRPCDGTSGLVRGNLRKAVFAFNRLFFQRNSLRFSLRDARCRRVFWKCGEKSEIAEHNPIFGNKTAGRESVKSGSGRSISVFPALPVFASVGDRVHLYPRLDNGQNSQLRLHTKTPAEAKLLLPALVCLLALFSARAEARFGLLRLRRLHAQLVADELEGCGDGLVHVVVLVAA